MYCYTSSACKKQNNTFNKVEASSFPNASHKIGVCKALSTLHFNFHIHQYFSFTAYLKRGINQLPICWNKVCGKKLDWKKEHFKPEKYIIKTYFILKQVNLSCFIVFCGGGFFFPHLCNIFSVKYVAKHTYLTKPDIQADQTPCSKHFVYQKHL